jgi:tetratricopeptide (TPR) repeat protein
VSPLPFNFAGGDAMNPSFKLIAALFFSVLLFTATIFAQDAARYDADREKAFYLIQQNNLKDALPLLEKLYASKPDDTKVLQNLALALVANAATNSDKAAAIQTFKRARALAEQAQKLGDNSELVQSLLARIPADGNFGGANRKATPAEEALYAGERAFNSGELEKAIAEYERAAQLDPKLYEAPLYIGDVYFKMGKIDEAGKAYARAIALNPDHDTAYRFWGNVLLQNGRMKEAREQLIEAVIAEPYSRATWQFLSRWAQVNKVQLGHPRVDIPESSVKKRDEKNIDLNVPLSEKNDGTAAWVFYSLTKAVWLKDDAEFKKAYPAEARYRHSLQEELQCLRGALEALENQMKEKNVKEKDLDVSLANLRKLQRAGLLEAFILFAKADEGISRDYPEYRRANRAKLRQYLIEYVTASQ